MGVPGILSGRGSLSAVRWHPQRQSTTRLMPSEPSLNWLNISTPMIKKKLDLTTVLARIVQNADSLQASINRIEASSRSMLVAGWRPFIGWVCGITLAWHFLIQPILLFGLEAAGMDPLEWRQFDLTMLNTILFSMLGLGTLRTAGKVTGRA